MSSDCYMRDCASLELDPNSRRSSIPVRVEPPSHSVTVVQTKHYDFAEDRLPEPHTVSQLHFLRLALAVHLRSYSHRALTRTQQLFSKQSWAVADEGTAVVVSWPPASFRSWSWPGWGWLVAGGGCGASCSLRHGIILNIEGRPMRM